MYMLSYALLFALAAGGGADTNTVADTTAISLTASITDTVKKRPKPIEYSDAYATRLMIHRVGSYTMLPLFAGEYALGQNLMNGTSSSWVRPAHGAVALGLGALFTVNTVTGAWNLWEGRQDPAGRTRRFVHSALMIASDAGFAITGALGSSSASPADRRLHRNVALGSIGVATIGSAMMWFWKE
jgi:hypothetical protein